MIQADLLYSVITSNTVFSLLIVNFFHLSDHYPELLYDLFHLMLPIKVITLILKSNHKTEKIGLITSF